jgi:hypothetical protein
MARLTSPQDAGATIRGLGRCFVPGGPTWAQGLEFWECPDGRPKVLDVPPCSRTASELTLANWRLRLSLYEWIGTHLEPMERRGPINTLVRSLQGNVFSRSAEQCPLACWRRALEPGTTKNREGEGSRSERSLNSSSSWRPNGYTPGQSNVRRGL